MRKKSKVEVKEETADDYHQAINDLSEAITEALKETKDLEPFEMYTNKIRYKIISNIEEFRSRFTRGYQVLLEEISKETPQSR